MFFLLKQENAETNKKLKNKDNVGKREGKRDLPVSNLRMEVFGTL